MRSRACARLRSPVASMAVSMVATSGTANTARTGGAVTLRHALAVASAAATAAGGGDGQQQLVEFGAVEAKGLDELLVGDLGDKLRQALGVPVGGFAGAVVGDAVGLGVLGSERSLDGVDGFPSKLGGSGQRAVAGDDHALARDHDGLLLAVGLQAGLDVVEVAPVVDARVARVLLQLGDLEALGLHDCPPPSRAKADRCRAPIRGQAPIRTPIRAPIRAKSLIPFS